MIEENLSIANLTSSPLQISSKGDGFYADSLIERSPSDFSNFNSASSSLLQSQSTDINQNYPDYLGSEFAVNTAFPNFESGVFTVDSSGKIKIDYLLDGGAYQGELAIFNLQGMEPFTLNYQNFIEEAAKRALSNSNWGRIVISDLTEGAKLTDLSDGINWNFGEYKSSKEFEFQAGDRFGLMLVPNGRVSDILHNPNISGDKYPLFSMATANPDDGFYLGQLADVTGKSNIFAMEDWQVNRGGDRDYNDLIFSITGATGYAVSIETVINPEYNWCGSELWNQLIESVSPNSSPEINYIPDQLLVKFNPNLTDIQIAEIAQSYGATEVENILPPNINTSSRLAQWRLIDLPSNVDIQQVHANFATNPNIIAADFNYKISLYAQPNDANFNQQWGLHNIGQNGGKPNADINAPEAWDIQIGSPSVVVAIVDSGIDYTHPDLAANIWRNPGEIAGNGIDDDGNGYIDDVRGYDFVDNDADPINGDEWEDHGTHIAGIIGAVGNNNIGITGVNQSVSLMPLRFAEGLSGSVAGAAKSILYAINNGADIINASWGTSANPLLLADAVSDAYDAGVLVVAAAGNLGENNDITPNFPSNYPLSNILSVASTTDDDQLSDFSNYGQLTVDLAAPGGNNAWLSDSEDILSTTPNNSYSYMNGTSMATAYVSGAAALLLANNSSLIANNSDLTAQVLSKILIGTADLLPSLQGKTVSGGRLNLQKALLSSASSIDSITNLATLEEIGGIPYDLNELGQIIGYSYISPDRNDYHAFLWDVKNGMKDLGTLGGLRSEALGINNSGQVVGYSTNARGYELGFIWDSINGMRNLGTLPDGGESRAYGINEAGIIVGSAKDFGGRKHSVVWQDNFIIDQNLVPDLQTSAYRVNNKGQITGSLTTLTQSSSITHAYSADFDFSEPVSPSLDIFSFSNRVSTVNTVNVSFTYDINDKGEAVGYAVLKGKQQAILYNITSTGFTSQVLQSSEYLSSAARSVNNLGKAVGYGTTYDGDRALLWNSPAQAIDLNTLIDPNSGWILNQALGINNKGQIVGNGLFNGQNRGFLMTLLEV